LSGRNPARRLTRSVADRAFDYVEAKRELDRRTSPLLKATLRTLWAEYHAAAARGGPLPSVWDTGLRVFSEHDEDGLVLFLLAVVGCDRRWFVDIGSGDGVHASNCANLAFNLGFHGLFVEADEESVARGRAAYDRHPDTRGYAPRFVHAFATAATVDATIREAGFQGDIALLSVDIDGNDYWIWKAIESVAPRVVVEDLRRALGRDSRALLVRAARLDERGLQVEPRARGLVVFRVGVATCARCLRRRARLLGGGEEIGRHLARTRDPRAGESLRQQARRRVR